MAVTNEFIMSGHTVCADLDTATDMILDAMDQEKIEGDIGGKIYRIVESVRVRIKRIVDEIAQTESKERLSKI